MQEPKKIRVCHFTSAHPSDDVRIFHKECVSLAKAGYGVFLVAANTNERFEKGVQIINASSTATGRFSRMWKTTKAVYQKAKELDVDVYHFHDPELLPFALKLKRQGKKVIYDAHEDLPRQISGKPWIPALLRKPTAWIIEKYENYVVSRLNYVIVSTPTIERRFKKITSACLAVCNYPIVEEISSPSVWSEKQQEICYVGGLTKIRGIVEIVEALQFTPEVKLNLAGKFSPESFRNQVTSLRSWNQVNELGYQNREGIISILNRSKIGLVTLYPQSNYLDSLPIKMFEYMLAGIPVVASNFPLWKEIIADSQCGVTIDPKNPTEIAQAITELLSDDEGMRAMGLRGRQKVLEKYNWTAEAYKLLDIYDQVIIESK
ncbi:MAG: glycosyltransferase family 4 protein [Crocinitomicaceae bacterium]|nr:glycosyltransferase family 4 protein [Crocinitomicaceae bacterium]